MILGNKCDMDDKRQVSTERGMMVSRPLPQAVAAPLHLSAVIDSTARSVSHTLSLFAT